MQRAAQDWLVLTQLTHNNATAVGIVMALQFAPLLLFLPVTGFAADHLDRRFLLISTRRSGPVRGLSFRTRVTRGCFFTTRGALRLPPKYF
jgi:hypothetical protein